MAKVAHGCRCGKHLFEHVNEGTCWWCGHGDVRTPATPRSLARLPRDLGALQREGRRIPFGVFEHVVRREALTGAAV